MHRFSITLLLALTISSPVQAQLWDYIVTSDRGNRYYIDLLSIQHNGPIVSYLQLTNYPQGTDKANKEMLSFVQFKTNDCVRNQFTISHLIGYEYENAKRSIVTVEMERKPIWISVVPKKIADVIHQEVCNYKLNGISVRAMFKLVNVQNVL
jgi:hypothetical protein